MPKDRSLTVAALLAFQSRDSEGAVACECCNYLSRLKSQAFPADSLT